MRQRGRGSATESDSSGLIFDDDSLDTGLFDDDEAERDGARYDDVPDGGGGRDAGGESYRDVYRASHQTRAARRHGRGDTRRRRRARGPLYTVVGLALAAILAVAAWLIAVPVYHYLNPADYSGSGTGRVLVAVHTGDSAKTIGTTLHDDGVVASVRAFTDAAGKDDRSDTIQPGTYLMRKHMSAKAALGRLLDPSARQSTTVAIPEGATVSAVVTRLSAPACTTAQQRASKDPSECGLGLPPAKVEAATKNIRALGMPKGYSVGSAAPTSLEGFLYPATYSFDPSTSATDALQQMISRFIEQDRNTDFARLAGKLHLSPYQALIIASIAQSEAKYPSDMAKVTRVILNRLAANTPLKIDAVSRYGAVQQGLDPDKVKYDEIDSPYNTYLHRGLPPTPISNPGADAMNAAVHPTPGKWLYYVNGSADGHLYFTASEKGFVAAQQKCHDNDWGCAAP